jgi:hypothetical protein
VAHRDIERCLRSNRPEINLEPSDSLAASLPTKNGIATAGTRGSVLWHLSEDNPRDRERHLDPLAIEIILDDAVEGFNDCKRVHGEYRQHLELGSRRRGCRARPKGIEEIGPLDGV